MIYQLTLDDANIVYNYSQDSSITGYMQQSVQSVNPPSFNVDTGKYFYPLCDFFTYRDSRNEIYNYENQTPNYCYTNLFNAKCRFYQDYCHCKI